MVALINVSSLFPIDLTEALVASHLNGSEILLAVNTSARVTSDPDHRRFEARRSLPTCSWEVDHAGDWRMVHLSIDTSAGGCAGALSALERELLAQLVGRVDETQTSMISSRFEELRSATVGNGSWWEEIGNLGERALRGLGAGARYVGPYSDVEQSLLGGELPRTALSRLVGGLRPGQAIRFLRGGYIDVNHNGGVVRCRSARVISTNPATIRLLAHDGAAVEVLLTSETLPKMHFGGPMELALLGARYDLVEVPWFSYTADNQSAVSDEDGECTEFISPIVAVDPKRCSSRWGGGRRLSPSGYSLLDFLDHPLVGKFVCGLLKFDDSDSRELHIWRDWSEQVPPAKQKPSRSSKQARALRHELETSLATSLSHGLVGPQGVDGTSRSGAPQVLFSLGLIHSLRRIHLDETTGPQLRGLLKPEHINSSATGPSVKADWFREVGFDAKRLCDFLSAMGDESGELHSIEERVHACINEQTARGDWDVSVIARPGIGQLTRALQALLDRALGFILFFACNPIKTHLLLVYALLGPECIAEALDSLMARRGSKTTLRMRPELVEIVQ